MRLALTFVVAFFPAVTLAQSPNAAPKKQTLDWVVGLEAPGGGFYMAPAKPNGDTKLSPSLRATNAALRAIKYLGGTIPHSDRHAAFVLSCFDPKTGGFAEPGGTPDVATTSIGIMAAVELNIPKEKYAKAMDYLKENAKTFEDVRIGAAAVEGWGVKECPFKLFAWREVAVSHMAVARANSVAAGDEGDRNGGSRDYASGVALFLRLDFKGYDISQRVITQGQRDDGGWSKKGEKASDIESTYRVMRALMLLKEKPKDLAGLRKFVASHRNADGGYATKPGDKSSASGVYYATIITKWLDEMEKR